MAPSDILSFLNAIFGDQNVLLGILVLQSSLSIGLFIAIYKLVRKMKRLIEEISETSESIKNDMYLISGEINKMHNVLVILDGKNNEIRRSLQLLKESNILEQLVHTDYIRYSILTAGLQKQIKKDIDKLIELINNQCNKQNLQTGSDEQKNT